jgi:GT2 family glycosyltransferase
MFEELPPHAPASFAVQTLLYQTSLQALERTLEALDNSARLGVRDLMCSGFTVVIGDASPKQLVSDHLLYQWRERFTHIDRITYTFFNKNVGTSKGHNAMAASFTDSDYIVTSNPDVVPEPRALWRMLRVFDDPTVGMVEAKQLPIEHAKEYDPTTGLTSWATTAFAMTPRPLFDQLGGFDADTFFMYCDDVDYSWRVREAGRTVVFQPSAVVLHDKRLSTVGHWMPTDAEIRYSASAALLLAHKWSRDDLVEKILAQYKASNQQMIRNTATRFEKRRKAGKLVPQRDPNHKIATFVGTFYAKHRYIL